MTQSKETIVSISMVKLNIYLLILTIAMILGVGFLHVFLFKELNLTITLPIMIFLIVAMIVLICIHEALHLIGFRYIGGVPWSELAWGINLKLGVAYAHSKKPITVEHMKKALLLPLVPTGILPLVIGVVLNFPALSFLGVLLTAGCIGDLVLYQKLLKFPNDAMVIDHPSKPQFTVYE
ncbi:DUF3267 domain-containing protein [Bacillus sp. NPDC094106]|uniref:DUF3267 domain-containing protein n=1 Tax=Bacillus sp. NPDC094106 TaxID=3363949 RepID=UPI00382BE03B